MRTNRWTTLLLAGLVATLGATTGCEPDTLTEPGTHPATSRLGISPDGSTLYVALADHDLVRAVDAETGETLRDIAVPGHPHRLTVLSDGRVAVSARFAGEVAILSSGARSVETTIEVGSDPFGLIEADDHLVVALNGQQELARIDLRQPDGVKDRVFLEEENPRGLARAADGTVFVSHFHTGKLSAVDLDSALVETKVDMKLPSHDFFFPNQVDTLTVSPDGTEVVVPHVECNNDPAQFTAGGSFAGALPQYYVEGPTGYPAVVPAVTRVDAPARVSTSDGPGAINLSNNSGQQEIEPAGPVPAIINPLNTALLGDDLINGPTAVALGDGGRVELLVNKGSGNVFLRRTTLREGDRSILGKVDVGTGADAIVLSPDGGTAYVLNTFTHEVTAFPVPHVTPMASGAVTIGSKAMDHYNAGDGIAEVGPLWTKTVAEQVLPNDVVEGRILFHSVDERLTRRGAVSCASCHPGGEPDKITWEFEEGPRNTPPLWGGILGTEPFHWNDEVEDMADINEHTVRERMGGSGLPATDMNKIGAFLDTLPIPAPPAGLETDAVSRGEAIFFAEETGCVECHAGADFTDNLAHDVGTGIGFAEREQHVVFATPPLKGLAHTGPYLHDGSAETLRDVIELTVLNDRMGTGSHLTADEVDDLVAFLSTL